MAAGADVAGPVGYHGGWLVLAVALLVVVVLWNGGVLFWGRPRRERHGAARLVDVPALRQACLGRIAAIEASRTDGEIDDRRAHLELSAVCRAFVQDLTGHPTVSSTLTDLRDREGTAPLAELVERLYPPEFGRQGSVSGEEWNDVLARARRLVETAPWS